MAHILQPAIRLHVSCSLSLSLNYIDSLSPISKRQCSFSRWRQQNAAVIMSIGGLCAVHPTYLYFIPRINICVLCVYIFYTVWFMIICRHYAPIYFQLYYSDHSAKHLFLAIFNVYVRTFTGDIYQRKGAKNSIPTSNRYEYTHESAYATYANTHSHIHAH